VVVGEGGDGGSVALHGIGYSVDSTYDGGCVGVTEGHDRVR